MKEVQHSQNQRQRAIDLLLEYCTFVALKSCSNDANINKHLSSIIDKLSDDNKKLLLECIHINLKKIENKINLSNLSRDDKVISELSDNYKRILNTPIEKFAVDKIIEAMDLTKTSSMIYSSDFRELKYETIKETLPIEVARRTVLRKLEEARKNKSTSKNSSSCR